MSDDDVKIAVLAQKVEDIARRVSNMENTHKVLTLLVLTTVIGTVLRFIGLGG